MKQKISPEDYSKIIEVIELENISLLEGNLKVSDSDDNGGTINLKLSDKYTYEDKKDKVIFYASCKLLGHKEQNEPKNLFFTISSKYKIVYNKSSDIQITDDFFEIFREISLSIMIWPYIREYIQNNLCRAGLPSLTLPLRKIC